MHCDAKFAEFIKLLKTLFSPNSLRVHKFLIIFKFIGIFLFFSTFILVHSSLKHTIGQRHLIKISKIRLRRNTVEKYNIESVIPLFKKIN